MCTGRLIALILGIVASIAVEMAGQQSTAMSEKMSSTPLVFTKNMGQWDEQVLFRATAGGATMWFTKEGVTYQFFKRIPKSNSEERAAAHFNGIGDPAGLRSLDKFGREPDSVEQLVLTAKFVGANPNPDVAFERPMAYKCNYFLGNNPSEWHTDVPNFQSVTLKNVYPGIDLRYSSSDGEIAYEFVSESNADVSQIRIEYSGADKNIHRNDGSARLKASWGTANAPMSEIVLNRPVPLRLSLSCDRTASPQDVNLASPQSKSLAPILSYSTCIGGEDQDIGYAIAVDANGCSYVTGYTLSTAYPALNQYQTDQGDDDVVITKLSAEGNSLVYSTYLGGDGWDWGYTIAVDDSSNAYVAGFTFSTDFPTANPLQTYSGTTGYRDAFVAKVNSTGDGLIFSTYLGGTAADEAYGIVVDHRGSVYVAGCTESPDFPVQSAFQSAYQGSGDAFVAKLASSGSSIDYSSYLGGAGKDWASDLAVDSIGEVFLTGYTWSNDYPTSANGYLQSISDQGEADAFVTKFSSAGSTLIYSTYLGSSGYDGGWGIAIDRDGCAYIAGVTNSPGFPALHPYQTYLAGYDAFISKLNGTGSGLVYSTLIGGRESDWGKDIAVAEDGSASIIGYTNSDDFPLVNPIQTYQGGYDVFATKLAGSGSVVDYSTYLGGSADEVGNGISLDDLGSAYLVGYTASGTFPVQNAFESYQGWDDLFVTKLSEVLFACGDVDANTIVDISDVVYLIVYIFSAGPAPNPLAAGDANCDQSVDISDAVYLIQYIFAGGPAPCAACK